MKEAKIGKIPANTRFLTNRTREQEVVDPLEKAFKSNLPDVYRKFFVTKEEEIEMVLNPSARKDASDDSQLTKYSQMLTQIKATEEKFNISVRHGFPSVNRKLSFNPRNDYFTNTEGVQTTLTAARQITTQPREDSFELVSEKIKLVP